MKKYFKFIIILAFLIYLGSAAFLYINQRDFIYFPRKPINNIGNYITYQNNDEKIRVNLINANQQKAIIYFGGNAELVSYNSKVFSDIFPNHTIYLVNYRGYGGSTGIPTEKAIYSDALYIFDQVKKKHSEITIIGRSLGSGVATLVASKREISKLVLITPFDSVQNIAQKVFPIYPMSLLLKEKYNSAMRAHSIKAKVLLLIAENYNIIPIENSENLARKFKKEQLEVKIIPDSDHNTISASRSYYRILSIFVN